MKKKTTSNPLKFFNDAKEARNKSFSKSLPKAQNGIEYKGSELAKEYAKAPMVGAEPEWSYLAGQKEKSAGPVTNPSINSFKPSPYNRSSTIYRNQNTGEQTGTANSNVINDPRFSESQEKTNEFYNKEKNAGTLYSNKGFSARRAKSAPAKGSINVVNDIKKNGGAITKMQKGGTITIKTISPNDPYEVAKRKLQQDKLAATKKRDLAIATAKRKREEERNKNLKLKVQLTGKMAKGGATKATKFAALAPPYNKATAADRIVGAKKNAKKK